METTGFGAFCINVNNEGHHRIIHNMVISGLLYSNQHEKNYFVQQQFCRYKIDSVLEKIFPHLAWYDNKPIIC